MKICRALTENKLKKALRTLAISVGIVLNAQTNKTAAIKKCY